MIKTRNFGSVEVKPNRSYSFDIRNFPLTSLSLSLMCNDILSYVNNVEVSLRAYVDNKTYTIFNRISLYDVIDVPNHLSARNSFGFTSDRLFTAIISIGSVSSGTLQFDVYNKSSETINFSLSGLKLFNSFDFLILYERKNTSKYEVENLRSLQVETSSDVELIIENQIYSDAINISETSYPIAKNVEIPKEFLIFNAVPERNKYVLKFSDDVSSVISKFYFDWSLLAKSQSLYHSERMLSGRSSDKIVEMINQSIKY